ncbi:MAG: sulfur oxidation c-type cytochrome SoxX [Gammaproteobacteria bacterium]|nr:sulfur oxidation c-type cytochrome SoxX [Gammaproteobacteria bacterium]
MKFRYLTRLVVGPVALLPLLPALPAVAQDRAVVLEQGKQLSFERSKGNCLACHVIEGGESPGNIGPPLVMMQARYPDKSELRAQIWDAHEKNPDSIMPPYGRTYLLQESEIDKVTEFIWSL